MPFLFLNYLYLVHLFQVGLSWHTIGIYHSAISSFLEPHHLQKACNHPVISKWMCHFIYSVFLINILILRMLNIYYLCFESWVLTSSLTVKLAWKTATLLALVTAKHWSDLTLLCTDNQDLFLQCHAANFIPMSGGKTDHLGHLPPQICIESCTNVNLALFFYLKAYLRCTEPFRMKSDGSLFLGSNWQHQPVCAKTISSLIRKVCCVAKAHMSLGSLCGLQILQP